MICQPAGSSVSNKASLAYTRQDNSFGIGISNQTDTQVEIAPPNQNGSFFFSAAPEFCSQNGPVAGATDMDWGDFDNDGDLDVALVSESGVFVYRNTGGDFEFLWQDGSYEAQTARWGDFDNNSDGYLELVVEGTTIAVFQRVSKWGGYLPLYRQKLSLQL